MKDRLVLLALLACAGCPAGQGKPAGNPATVKGDQLPSDVAGLLQYSDEQYRLNNSEGAENALIALDKALGQEKSYEASWRAARAASFLTEEAGKGTRAKDLAGRGVEYAKQAVALDGRRIEGLYYHALTLGQYAYVEQIKARQLVPQVEEAAKRAVAADEKFDHAGPLRLLGSLYAQAPPPPTSVGDSDEGVRILAKAVQLAGNYPQNHLLLAEAHLKNDNLDQAEREFQVVVRAPEVQAWAHRLPRWREQAEAGLKRIGNLRRQRQSGRGGDPF